MRPDAPREAERSFPELLRELGDELSTLIRQELALAKVELAEKGRAAGASAGMFGAGAMLALGAFFALTAAVIAALALAMPVWAAALVVAAIYGIAAYVLAQRGREQLKEAAPPIPEQTAQTVKEDIAWVKMRAKSGVK